MVSFFLLSAFLSYNTAGAGSLPKVYSACTGVVGIWGLWVVSCFLNGTAVATTVPDPTSRPTRQITFSGPAVVSRKTGADKHTSAFIFGNKFSASEQKKRWKREQQKKGQGQGD